MRVIHLCHLPLPGSHPDRDRLHTHPGRWVLNLALAQKAHTPIRPELLIQVPGASRDHYDVIEGIPCHFVRIPDRGRTATLFEFDRRRLARHALRLHPDLVHAHGTEEAYGLAAQTTGKPYIITAQGLLSQINHVLPPPRISRERIIEFLERRCLNKATDIIAKSDYVADWLAATYPRLTIHRIPNTFDPRLLDIPIPDKIPASLAFVGAISPRKGLHLLAEALEKHLPTLLDSPDSEGGREPSHLPTRLALHIFGNSKNPSDYEKSTISDLQSSIGDRLILHGKIPPLDLARALATIQFLIAPSLEEMFGNQVIEATLMGAFPIVSSNTAMAENVQRFAFGATFQNNDAEDLARVLSKALDMDQRATRNAQRSSKQRLLDYMGPARVATMHLLLYEKILNRPAIRDRHLFPRGPLS